MTRRVGQAVVTLVLLAVLFCGVDARQLVGSLFQIESAFGAAALALLLIQNDLATRRWATLLHAFGNGPNHFRMLRIQYMALFAQLFLPASIGGAAVRTGMLCRS